jgi:hypothetical protein
MYIEFHVARMQTKFCRSLPAPHKRYVQYVYISTNVVCKMIASLASKCGSDRIDVASVLVFCKDSAIWSQLRSMQILSLLKISFNMFVISRVVNWST